MGSGVNEELLVRLFGRAGRREVVVVTGRGVEIPLGRSEGWTVEALAGLLGEIDALPETEERDE